MFDPQTELPLNHSNPSDRNHFRYDSYGARIKKTVQKYDTYRSWNHNNGSGGGGGGGLHFSGDDGNDEESGVCSPPLWKTSSPNHHNQQQNNYRYLSPAQKSQAVAKGQRELMEMIQNMPESSYELSLKDIVEYPSRIESRHENVSREMLSDATSFDEEVVLNLKDEEEEKKKKKQSGKKKGQAMMRRSGSIDSGGFLLKMVFPFPWGSSNKNNNNKKMTTTKKKKTTNNIAAPAVTSTCSKVSPRPTTSDKSKILDGSEKSVVDTEWWKKKRLSNSRDSDSGGMSSINSASTGSSDSSSSTRSNCNSNSNSNSNNSRNRRFFSSGCWSFFHINKGKNHK